MPRAAALLPLILALAACAGKKAPTRIVEPAMFEKGKIQRIAFMGGDTMAPDVQNGIVDALTARFTNVSPQGSIYRRQAVLTQLGSLHLPPPDPKKVARNADRFGNMDPKFAAEVKTKLNVDAFYVLWVTDWTGNPVKTSGLQTETEKVEIRREVVAQIFEAGTGRELWHSRWLRPREESWVRLVPQEEYDQAMATETAEAVEELWVSFWIN